MKTTISLPDELVVAADNLAQTLGISRSELYAEAIRAYIARHTKTDLVERINGACKSIETSLPDDIASAVRNKLLKTEW